MPRKFFTGIILAFLLAFCSQETYASDILKDSTKQRVPLMKKIENFALKDNLVSKLLRNVLVFNNEEPSTDNNNNNNSNKDTTKVSEKPFNKYENKTIRNINIQVLNPFGYSVNTPVCHDINWFEKLGNRVHYPTRAWIVKNKLLFRKNEQIDAFKISESERLLRQSSYINDAKILVNQVNDSTDSVDVTIYVQDVWGIGVGVTGDPSVPNGDISFNDNNFLGLGQRLDTKLWYDEKYYNHIKFYR
ncbi:MAG: hypothetical protein EOP53_19610 [Sphingobacteriales bacterium]|nr:MAG: hypothetical protein EOP53_19610 [Sphingobacteriales bacterium]